MAVPPPPPPPGGRALHSTIHLSKILQNVIEVVWRSDSGLKAPEFANGLRVSECEL